MIKLAPLSPLKKKAVSGAIWTIGSYGFGQGLRFVSNLVLTRLLFPQLFGLMTLANVFLMGISLFSDIGIGPSIIQNKRGDDRDFLNTAWTVQVLRGVLVWICAVILAYPVSLIYSNKELLWLVPLLGFTAVISGFSSTDVITCNRRMEFKRLTIFELTCQIISLTITIVWAWLQPSIWALVGGTFSSTVIRTIGTYFLFPGSSKNRFHWDKEILGEILKFGKWIFLTTALTFFSTQTDRLILGKVFTLTMFGVLTIAYSLSDVPRQVIGVLGDKVIFPAVSKLTHLPREEFRERILKNRWPLLLALGTGLALLACFGDIIIRILYDARYSSAAWMFPLLALGIWPTVLGHTMDTSLYAIGRIQSLAVGHVGRIVFTVVGIPLGMALLGIPGAVIAIALSNIPFYLAVTGGAMYEKIAGVWQDIKATLLFGAFVAILLIGRAVFGFGNPFSGMF